MGRLLPVLGSPLNSSQLTGEPLSGKFAVLAQTHAFADLEGLTMI